MALHKKANKFFCYLLSITTFDRMVYDYVTWLSILLDLHAVFVCTLLPDFRLYNLIQQVLRLFNVFFMYLYHH